MYAMVINLNQNVTPWHTGHTDGTNFIVQESGASEFFSLLNCSVASAEFIIKPDFTWEKVDVASDSTDPAIGSEYFTSKGIETHKCTGVHQNVVNAQTEVPISVDFRQTGLVAMVKKRGRYTIKMYSVSGQLLYEYLAQELTPGANYLSFNRNTIPDGVYVVRIQGNSGEYKQRLIVP